MSIALLENFWRISLYVTDDAIAKLYVTQSLVKYREIVDTFVTIASWGKFSNSGVEIFPPKNGHFLVLSPRGNYAFPESMIEAGIATNVSATHRLSNIVIYTGKKLKENYTINCDIF